MNTYAVYFASDLQWACRDLKATTPEQALERARKLAGKHSCSLDFSYFEACHYPINEIEVHDDKHNSVAVWFDKDVRLRLASRALLAAAEQVVASWEQGDLAGAVCELDFAIAKAKGGAT
jgi:hypothetical protein